MKMVTDDRFGSVNCPSNFNELIKLILGHAIDRRCVHMWRGQASDKWLLDSGAYRRLMFDGVPTERQVCYYEKDLLRRATHKGFRFFEGRELSDFELLARLQHHGAATRLFDTTRNALVALYFACSSHPKENGMLFGIHSDSLGGSEGRPVLGDYDEIVRSAGKHDHPQTWQPTEVSKRIVVQHSQFVYSKTINGRHGSLDIGDVEKYLVTIRIAAKLKVCFLRIISEAFDINRSGLFPDLQGFSELNSANEPNYSSERW